MMSTELILEKTNNKREVSNFTLFLLGKLVSIFGSSIYTFAIGLYVLRITGSGLSFATTLVLGIIPMIIINPFAGVMADRFDKKKLVVGMDLANGVLLLIVYFLSSFYGLSLTIVYVSTFIMTAFTTVFNISIDAATPNIVSEKMLMNVNSISKIIDSVSSILGPMIGGMVFAFMDIKAFILINGISFIFSGISEMFIDFRFNYNEEFKVEGNVDFIMDIKEGFKYLLERKDIISMFATFIVLNIFLGFSVSIPLPFIINNVLKLGSGNFGIIQGAFPMGMIIGAVMIKKIIEKITYNRLLMYVSFVLSICMVLIGLPVLFTNISIGIPVYMFYYSLVMVILGITISSVDIPIAYMLQKLIPDEYRGRVLSIGMSMIKIILPIALILSGVLLNIMPSYILPIAGGILFLIINLILVRKNSK